MAAEGKTAGVGAAGGQFGSICVGIVEAGAVAKDVIEAGGGKMVMGSYAGAVVGKKKGKGVAAMGTRFWIDLGKGGLGVLANWIGEEEEETVGGKFWFENRLL